MSECLLKQKFASGGGGGRLPAEYQEVTYIKATGTQYLNSGVNASSNLKVYSKFAYIQPTVTGESRFLVGSDNGWLVRDFAIIIATVDYASFRICMGTSDKLFYNTFLSINEIELSYSGGTINGSSISLTGTTFTSSFPLYIFANNRSGSAQEKSPGAIYSLKIWDGSTLVRDFVPCYRKSDGVVGMYDLVGKQFYTNLGTGTFIIGEPV